MPVNQNQTSALKEEFYCKCPLVTITKLYYCSEENKDDAFRTKVKVKVTK